MPMQLYVGLDKMSCDLCGKLGEAPAYTVTHVETNHKADICCCCYRDSMKHEPFKKGLEEGKIKVIER